MTLRLAAAAIVLAMATTCLAGCQKSSDAPAASGGAKAGAGAQLSGAGATFPAPVYQKWAEAYRAAGGQGLNYQAIGSGGGIKQIESNTVDFGATDKPLKADELDRQGLVQFPTVMGGVVPVVNLTGVAPGQLRLSGPLLADIYLGAITRWSDGRIAAANPGVRLPNLPITVVHRSDGSGTSFLYTSYLALVSPAWAQKVGASDSVQWPTGQGGKGNDGVAAMVRQTPGSIGYVEYVFAKQNNLSHAMMQDHDGQFVAPTAANFGAAAANADWAHAPGFYLLLLNQPGSNAWPITGATFILMHKRQQNATTGANVLKFFDWGYRSGGALATQLDFVPLPAPVQALARSAWAQVVGPDQKPVYAPK